MPRDPNIPVLTAEAKRAQLERLSGVPYELERFEEQWVSMCHESGMHNVARGRTVNRRPLHIQFAIEKEREAHLPLNHTARCLFKDKLERAFHSYYAVASSR